MRCCFVTKKQRAKQLSQTKPDITPCPDVSYPYGGSKIIKVPGKVRETAFEIFYEEDNDHLCLSTMILDAILRVNVDLRVKLAENILLIGGTCMTPGFKARLKEELFVQLKSERYNQLKIDMFKFHTTPAKENYAAWLGGDNFVVCRMYLCLKVVLGAIYGSTELLSMKALTKENYFKDNRLPDWADMRDNSHSL